MLDYGIVEGGPSLLPAVIPQQPDPCVRTSLENTETGDVLTQTPAPDSLLWYEVAASGGGSAGSASSGPRLLDPFCRQQAWDSLCVAEVTSICGYNCN